MTDDEFEEVIEENIRLGYVERVGRDKFRLTDKGKKYVETAPHMKAALDALSMAEADEKGRH